MPRIKDSSVEDVKAAADIVAVVSGRTQLRKAGARYLGRCPFHEERTPSFSVNPTDKLYYCFGCGAKGDLITFVRETEQLDFAGAVEWLADRFNVQVEYEETSPQQDARRRRRERLLDLLYGLDRARAAIAKQERAVVVEGNTDVLALSQAGIEPVVAAMGTALTERQLQELGRLTKRIWLCFDGDAAGEAATLRGMELAAAQGFDVRVVALPAGIDPADAADRVEASRGTACGADFRPRGFPARPSETTGRHVRAGTIRRLSRGYTTRRRAA